jgi:hypothetical protein
VERSFDNWAMAVTKDMEYMDGPLVTDRTHFFKFYGAYSFPFGLTVGSVVNLMSGTPFTETWYVWNAYFYPYNRGYSMDDSGNLVQERMPFLWFANAYAEYNLRLADKFTIQFNVNVDNLFNVGTARYYYRWKTYYGIDVSEAEMLAGGWDITDTDSVTGEGIRNYVEDSQWKMESQFYPPISIRLGVKFIF